LVNEILKERGKVKVWEKLKSLLFDRKLKRTCNRFLERRKFMKALCHRWNGKVFALVFLVLFSPGWAFSQPIPFETIDIGEISYFRYGDPLFQGAEIVIRELDTWRWFWKIHTQGVEPPPPLPKVDFLREMVIAVILGIQASGGGPEIEITSIEVLDDPFGSDALSLRNRRGIKVTVKESREGGPLPVITNPYHIVRVRSGSTVMIEHEPFDQPCEDNSHCSIEEFCEKKPGDCRGMGICKEKPVACPLYFRYDPVCGCNGKTYESECAAAMEGVSVLYKGECKVGQLSPLPFDDQIKRKEGPVF
jgi:hypothetical protein